ncbi:MAG: hypothetical protein CVV60_05515, partial [Tenericutes bacterium HGW-Tenericutes-5]
MKGKIDARIWEKASKKEKNKAYLFCWGNLIVSISIYLLFIYWLYDEGQKEENIFSGLESGIKIIIFVLLLLFLFVPIIRGTSIIFEMKNIRGKFGIEAIFLILFVIPTSGLNLLLAFLFSNFTRRQIIKATKPKFEGKETLVNDHSIEIDLSKALYCLSDAIKLEGQEKYKEAYKKYQEAYFLGDGRGAYYLARMYEDGIGIRKDINESLKWEKKAADKGVSLSQYYIGLEYIRGNNLSKNEELGMSYLEKSAKQNEFDACYYLGIKHGSDMNEKYFNLEKAEEYLFRAIKYGENDEEKGEAINELGRLWMGIYGESYDIEHYKMGLQLFKKAKSYDNEDAITNYKAAVDLRLPSYPTIEELLKDWVVDSYLNSKSFEKTNEEEKDIIETEETIEEEIFEEVKETVYNPEVDELKSLRTGLIVSSVIKLLFFGAGLFIVLWGVNNAENLFVFSPFVVIGGVIVGGLPGLPKAFNDSYNYNKKWDKFFRRADYKATIDLDKRTVKVKKNDDWLSIIFVTILNLLKTACAAPFEALRDFYRAFVVT